MIRKLKYTYKEWDFTLTGVHQELGYRVIAEKEDITECMFVEEEYIENESDFIKECERFYGNNLEGIEI